MSVVLQLSLCVVSVIQLTSSQSSYDVTPQANDVSSCGSSELSEDVLRQLVTMNSRLTTLANAVCQLQRDVAEVKANVGEVNTNMSQLERGVGEVKAELQRGIAEMKAHVGEVKTNMSQLQRDVVELKADVSEIKTNMSQLERCVCEVKAQLERGIAEVKAGVGDIKTNMSQLQRDVAELKAVISPMAKDCPANFTYISSVNGCYRVVNRNLNWTDAGLECRSLHKDAHLLVITDAQEQLTVAGLLASILSTNATLTGCYASPTHGTCFWTAGQRWDPSSNSTFVWRVTSSDTSSDRVSAMTYTNWAPLEPNYHEQAESCMHLWSAHSYTWNDARCSTAVCSVCELDT